jgi:hypothetical protein
MMDDRIILYLDGQLSEKDKLDFENELKENDELKSQMEKYKSFFSSINSLKNIEIDEVYFANNIPRFRGKLDKKRKFVLVPKFSLILSTAVAVFLIFFLILNNNKTETSTKSLNTLVKNANQNEMQAVFDTYTNNLNLPDALNASTITDTNTSSVINQSFFNELHLSQNEVQKYLNSQNIDYNNLISGLGDHEIETLYNELNSKKYY